MSERVITSLLLFAKPLDTGSITAIKAVGAAAFKSTANCACDAAPVNVAAVTSPENTADEAVKSPPVNVAVPSVMVEAFNVPSSSSSDPIDHFCPVSFHSKVLGG